MSEQENTISKGEENIKIRGVEKDFIRVIYGKFNLILKFFYDIAGFFILWITIHFCAANLYYRFCAEPTFIGYIKSIFVAQTPHCIAMRWVIYNGGNIINSMWLSIALWLTTKVCNKIIQ
jgi:hypothetical protein